MLLHCLQELDDDLGTGSDQNLALARFLSVVDGIERIVEDARLDHCVMEMERFSTLARGEVSAERKKKISEMVSFP